MIINFYRFKTYLPSTILLLFTTLSRIGQKNGMCKFNQWKTPTLCSLRSDPNVSRLHVYYHAVNWCLYGGNLRGRLHSLTEQQSCQDVVKEVKVWEKEALSVTGRFWEITSRVSQNQPSVVWLAEVVSNVSPVSSTRKPEVSWKCSLKCHPWCCHLHRARQEENRHCHGRCLCFEETRTYPVRIRRLNPLFAWWQQTNGRFNGHLNLSKRSLHWIVYTVSNCYSYSSYYYYFSYSVIPSHYQFHCPVVSKSVKYSSSN